MKMSSQGTRVNICGRRISTLKQFAPIRRDCATKVQRRAAQPHKLHTLSCARCKQAINDKMHLPPRAACLPVKNLFIFAVDVCLRERLLARAALY